ncbi:MULTISPECIES: hypothetical protein [Pseudomonas]|uniref:Uncharacterized protein n=1 Tax=Pseudomonas rustica TaxID=2827099 RepID=A0ABS5N454_9PSED|nr:MULTISPECIES: hypothetical protein [Pseudomonas]MBS4081352.1 hypothetical protein [Pseudomonas rustica]
MSDDKSTEEQHREDFEDEAFASGEFKGIRFTKNANGEYKDERLQKRWEAYLSMAKAIDNA